MNDGHEALIDAACAARMNSYSPYSKFRVGAALLAADGNIYQGTNVENASFGLSICAERTAVFRAVGSGQRKFTAIAICADGGQPTPPCGACRQVLLEFNPDMTVLFVGENGAGGPVRSATVRELVPDAFLTFQEDEGTTGDKKDGRSS